MLRTEVYESSVTVSRRRSGESKASTEDIAVMPGWLLAAESIDETYYLLYCVKRLCIFGPKGAIQVHYYYYYYYYYYYSQAVI